MLDLPATRSHHRRHRLALARGRGRDPRQRHPDRCRAHRAARRAAGHRPAAPVAVARRVGQRPRGFAGRRPHPRRRGQSHLAVRRGHPRQRPRRRQCAALRTAQRRPRQPDRDRPRAAIGAVGLRSDRRRGRGRRRRAGLRRDASPTSRRAASTRRRGAARTSFGTAERGVSLGIAGQRSDGIDSFSGDGERDGYRNLAGADRRALSPERRADRSAPRASRSRR